MNRTGSKEEAEAHDESVHIKKHPKEIVLGHKQIGKKFNHDNFYASICSTLGDISVNIEAVIYEEKMDQKKLDAIAEAKADTKTTQ